MEKNYQFFLSYARNDSQGNPWLKRLYGDLARDVRSGANLDSTLKATDIGFIDEKGIEGGTQWTFELAEALQSSKTLICLYSRSYFHSQWCGKEFQVFLDRLKALPDRLPGGGLPPLIQPVLWDRPDKLPKPLPKIIDDLKLQYANADYGEAYIENGLEYILRTEDEKAYQQFLLAFRECVVKAVKNYSLPQMERLEPWEKIESAFRAEIPPITTSPTVLPDTTSLPAASGPEAAWFVYVAGRDQDYAGIRSQRDCYGKRGGALWRPYSPPSDKTAGVIIQRVASSLGSGIFCETLPLSKQLIEHLRKAEDTNTLVIIIVDPWSMHLDNFRAPLAALDHANLVNCGVIIVWNTQDSETKNNQNALREKIEATFASTIVSEQIYFRDAAKSEEEFEQDLCDAIKSVSNKIIKRGKLLRRVDTAGGALPKLDVPIGN
jgi:FxsC-like protein